jgi:hypothetical protein
MAFCIFISLFSHSLCVDMLACTCAGCLEIWEPQPPENLWACNGIPLSFFINSIRRNQSKDLGIKTWPLDHWDSYQYIWRANRGRCAIQ